jgi:hypothetical protein
MSKIFSVIVDRYVFIKKKNIYRVSQNRRTKIIIIIIMFICPTVLEEPITEQK